MAEQKRLYRSTTNRMVGGVASGLARYLEVDPVFVRLAFVVLALFQGIGVITYLIMWLVVPDESARELTGEAVVRANAEDMRNRAQELTGSLRTGSQGPVIIGIALVSLGAIFMFREFFPSVPAGLLWPLVPIGIGAYLLFARR